MKYILRPYWFVTTTLSMAPSALIMVILCNEWLKGVSTANVGVQVWGMVMLVCLAGAIALTASLIPSFLILPRDERALIKAPYLLKLAAIPASYGLGYTVVMALTRWCPDVGSTTLAEIFRFILCGAHVLDLAAGVWLLAALVGARRR